jgi:hypothetical protein
MGSRFHAGAHKTMRLAHLASVATDFHDNCHGSFLRDDTPESGRVPIRRLRPGAPGLADGARGDGAPVQTL